MSEDTKVVKSTVKPPRAGMGRPKGSQNKVTKAVKDMIIGALEEKGGIEYLKEQADENPVAFMTLVGKIIPLQVTGDGGGPVQVAKIELVAPKT